MLPVFTLPWPFCGACVGMCFPCVLHQGPAVGSRQLCALLCTCAVVSVEGCKASSYAVAALVLLLNPIPQKLGDGGHRGLVWAGWVGVDGTGWSILHRQRHFSEGLGEALQNCQSFFPEGPDKVLQNCQGDFFGGGGGGRLANALYVLLKQQLHRPKSMSRPVAAAARRDLADFILSLIAKGHFCTIWADCLGHPSLAHNFKLTPPPRF